MALVYHNAHISIEKNVNNSDRQKASKHNWVGWKWKWPNCDGKGEMSLFWCIFITDNALLVKAN